MLKLCMIIYVCFLIIDTLSLGISTYCAANKKHILLGKLCFKLNGIAEKITIISGYTFTFIFFIKLIKLMLH